MRIRPSDKRPCRLAGGEVRRVPQDPRGLLVGYHLCCSRCGFVTVALVGADGLEVEEGGAPDDVTMSRPIRCTRCEVLIHVTAGEVRLEEDVHVRPFPHR